MKVRACTLINQGRERRGGRGDADEVGRGGNEADKGCLR